MEEELVSFEVAKLAKEKGFKELCFNYYFEDGEFREHKYAGTNGYYGEEFLFDFKDLLENWNSEWLTKKNGDRCFGCDKSIGYFETYSAPTQSLMQKWLREVHNVHISITRVYECSKSPAKFDGWNIYIGGESFETNYEINNTLISKYFETYEQALEDGLFEALKLID